MSSKSEFYTALDHLKHAARDAHKAMPDSFSSREKKLWGGLLSRMPEQIDDLKTNLDDPHTQTSTPRNRIVDPFH
jgi:hypothetical protein